MADAPFDELSRLERQIMDAIFRLGEAGVGDVTRIVANVSPDSVRVTMRNLEKKGHLAHRRDGKRHVYRPTLPPVRASRSAVRNLLRTFFKGSPSKAILTMLDMTSSRLSPHELDEIAEWIAKQKESE